MPRPFDSWRSLSVSLYMVLTGYAVLVGLPVISSAWVTHLGFSAVEAGRLAAADLGGLSLGAVICSLLIARLNRRHLTVGAVLLAIAANGACIFATDYPLVLVLRLLAGVASGIYTAIAVATLSATSNPARAFSLALFAFAISQAIELSLLPRLDMAGIYGVFAGCYALTLPFVRWLPARPIEAPAEAATTSRPPATWAPWLVLLAIFCTYVDIGTCWTFVELASLDAGVPRDWIGQVLVWSALCSILGCLVATRISARIGLGRALGLTLLAQTAAVALLAGRLDATTLAIGVSAFTCLWMLSDIYQIAWLARLDATGRFAALVPAAQGLGQIVGPTTGASLLGAGFGYPAVFALCAGASVVALAVYLSLSLGRRLLGPPRHPRRSPT